MDAAARDRPSLPMVITTGLFPLMFLAIGGFLAWTGWSAVLEGLAMRDWPEAPGRIVESRMPKVEGTVSTPGSMNTYELQLTYAYEVGGRTYRGERTGLFPDVKFLLPARDWVAAHSPGLSLRVRHDPKDPGRSIVDPSIGGGTWVMAIGAVPFLALGGVMLIGFVRAVGTR